MIKKISSFNNRIKLHKRKIKKKGRLIMNKLNFLTERVNLLAFYKI